MGTAGLEWDGGDGFQSTRGNQKCRFIGTGAQIAGLSVTYAGMEAFCTSTGSGFTVDNVYTRNTANTAWINNGVLINNITEASEENSTPVSDNGQANIVAGTRYYDYFTFPSDYPLYYVTGVEWKNGTVVAGNVIGGVDIVNADPPAVASTPLAGLTQEVAQTGVSAVQRASLTSSILIRAGAVVGIWVAGSSATGTLRRLTGQASQNRQKAMSYDATPPASNNNSWTASTNHYYVKLYYRGFY